LARCIALLSMFVMLAPGSAASDSEQASDIYTSENACSAIKAGMSALADSERAEALGLNLTTNAATAAVVEVRLNDLIERSDQLRATLRAVRISSVSNDSEVQECLAMGERTLASAEKLSSDVEEILLYSTDYHVADGPSLKSGEPAPEPSPQP
jgi:hypothetical protein